MTADPPSMELFEASGYYSVKNAKTIAEDKGSVTFEGDIQGDISFLEELLTQEYGKKVTLVKKDV